MKMLFLPTQHLGYECLARGKKVISFGLGSLKKNWCIQNGFEPN